MRIGVVGGGIVGIAIARALALRELGEVTVLEKESRLASHQTGRNSGVLHAGLYYRPGTLKAKLCGQGRELIREFCQEKNLPYREVGKLVVALGPEELAPLNEIERRARENGVPDLSRIEGAGHLREIEPHAAGIAAIHSPHTAAVDFVAVTEALARDVLAADGRILLGQEVRSISSDGPVVRLGTSTGDHPFDHVIVCAGLQSDVVAGFVGADPSPRILPFRGEYWALDPERADLVRGMIYPVPDPRFPFLGVHFSRGVYDQVRVGPNAIPALAREGYTWLDTSFRDTWNSITWPGAPALFRQHWRIGLGEVARSLSKKLYYQRARRFVPELRAEDLVVRSAAGVRAQAWNRDGHLLDDFSVEQVGHVTLLRNAPSPAATSSMAIAEYMLEHHLPRRQG